MTRESLFNSDAGSNGTWPKHGANVDSCEGNETPSASFQGMADHEPPFDLEELLDRCLGNVDIARRVMDRFESGFEEQMGQLQGHVEAGDAAAVAKIAHRLKGSAANVAAPALTHIAKTIEGLARAENLADIPAQLQALGEQWERFRDFRAACGEAMLCGKDMVV